MEDTVSTLSTPTLLADPQLDSEISDADFLGRFVSDQDEAAFAALVKRHGGLVRGVCRRILLDSAAADDAFQHTFFSLSQHAPLLLRTLTPSASLGSWLYRVAVNASLQLKRKARSRRRTETQFAEHRPSAQTPAEPWNEVLPALDEEISALPGQYRSAVVKCHLEGKTQQDAAKELGITYATLRRRLKEARGMLRNRLSQRGFVHNGFLLVPLLGQLFASDPVSAQTATAVTKTVLANGPAPAVAASASAGGSFTGGSLAWGTHLLAVNPLVKAVLAGAVMFGALGGWWMMHSDSAPETPSVPAFVADRESQVGEQEVAAKPISEEMGFEEHFPYILGNGEALSPEFENAVKALDDSHAKRRKVEADILNLPELKNSEVMLSEVKLDAPLPRDIDVLSENGAGAGALDDAIYWQISAPNLKLIDPSEKPQPEPLPVQEVIEILNGKKDRGSQYSVGPAVPPSSQFLGHHNPQPAKTLKVLPIH